MDVAIQVFAYDESDRLGGTLNEMAAQSLPPDVTPSYEAWVTPTTERPRDDPTFRIADDHPVFEAHESPRGKLSTRNVAHDAAMERGFDAFTVGDADVRPVDDDSLARLIEPLAEPDTAAANGSIQYRGSPLAPVATALAKCRYLLHPYMHGQASAMTTAAWERVGPFDEHLDQTTMSEVWGEEELGLYRRLRDIGGVANPRARFWEADRRVQCTVENANHRLRGRKRSDYCKRVGTETFAPREHDERRR